MKTLFSGISMAVLVVAGLLYMPSGAFGAVEDPAGTGRSVAGLHIPFVANEGQTDARVKYYAPTFGGTVFVTGEGTVLYSLPSVKNGLVKKGEQAKGVSLSEAFIGGKISSIKGEGKAATRISYFKGRDASKWKTDIAAYNAVNLGEVYPGIEVKLKAYGKNVEKLFYLEPGSNSEVISVKIEGAKSLAVDARGELVAMTTLGAVNFTKPIAYQEIKGKRVAIEAAYEIKGAKAGENATEYGFKIGEYNRDYPVVIDPLLSSTYIGGSGDDGGQAIAVDSMGNVFVFGQTNSSNYPTTVGAYDRTLTAGTTDVFVSKLSNDLSTLLASTYIGGNNYDEGTGIAIDSSDAVIVVGSTASTDFPTTGGAYHTSYYGGFRDAFVTKLYNNLTGLMASTYLGGNDTDYGEKVAVDSSDNIFVTGETLSGGPDFAFPVTPGAYDTTYDASYDIFVSKLSSNLGSLLASTFIGGANADNVGGIVMDSLDNVYITGNTIGDYPTTPGAYSTAPHGALEAVVSKLNNSLTTLMASTYIGGSLQDVPFAIARDSADNIFIAGYTASSDYPTTAGAYDRTGAGYDAFVSKFNPALTGLLASTYLGGGNTDEAFGLAIGATGDVFVCGSTYSAHFPTTPGAYDRTYNGNYDLFVSRLSNNLAKLKASTFVGGTGLDESRGIALDSSGNVFVTGFTHSSDFPSTPGAYDTAANGGSDVFVVKLTSDLSLVSAPSGLTAKAVSPSAIVLAWTDNSSDETGFRVERKAGGCSSGSTWSEIAVTAANTTTYWNGSLTAATTYSYRVRAYNGSGNSAYSNCASATTGSAGTPKSPTNFIAISISSGQVNLQWKDNSDNETGFSVHRKAGAGAWTLRTTTGANVESFSDTSATGNTSSTSYRYYVKACNDAGCSPATSVAVVPYAPTGLFAEHIDFIDISWTDNSSNETGFKIDRKNGDCSSANIWSLLTTVGANTDYYLDTTAYGGTFAYKVRAYTKSATAPFAYGYSRWSNCSFASN